MDLIQIASGMGDLEVDRAISLWKKIKEDHKNLPEFDMPAILTESLKDDYISRFIGAHATQDEFRRAQEILKVYGQLEEEFAYFIAKKVAGTIKNLRRGTYIEIGKALLKEKGI